MDIVIIGGGAAGMLAACIAAGNGATVTLIERNNSCGIKLNLTGKGRCNVTNNSDTATLMKNTVCNGKFLYSAYNSFTSQDTMAFFESIGVPLKTERGDRVFPASDNAKDLTGALRTKMKRLGVAVINERAFDVLVRDGFAVGVKTNRQTITADKIILATGGLSYPRTGSDGDGYKMAARLGHTIVPQSPSLVPLITSGATAKQLEGLALKNISVSIIKDSKTIFTDFGEMVFTDNGVSGPVILSSSAHINNDFPYKLKIDLKPALDFDTLDKRVLRDFTENINRDFANAINKLLPSKLISVIIDYCGIAPDQKVNTISKQQRETLCKALKGFELEVKGKGSYSEAVITRGGISTKEINPKTMESKLIKNLHFAGEIIDVDAYTGGFNLQIAWSTAFAAASACTLGDN